MKKFRSFRNKKKHLSSKYILLILPACVLLLCLRVWYLIFPEVL